MAAEDRFAKRKRRQSNGKVRAKNEILIRNVKILKSIKLYSINNI